MRALSSLLLSLPLLLVASTVQPLAAASPLPTTPVVTEQATVSAPAQLATPVLSEETFRFTPTLTAPSAVNTLKGVANRNANLRAGPGTTYAIVGGARKGTPLNIVATNPAGEWYQLDTGEWIAAFLVDKVGGALTGAAPVATPTAAVTSAPRVIMPSIGTELTLGDGSKIRHSIVEGVPDNTNNEWAQMRAGFGINVAEDGGPVHFRHNWTIQIKQGDLTEITITDVTGPRFVALIRDTAPAHPDGLWQGASAPVQMGHDTTSWLYQPGDTLFIYQVTLRFADGETITFYQPSSFPGDVKAYLLTTFADQLQ